MAIQCCYGCVAPKRNPSCHGHCPEYLAEKEQDEKEKEQYRKSREVSISIYQQRADNVAKARRRHRRM